MTISNPVQLRIEGLPVLGSFSRFEEVPIGACFCRGTPWAYRDRWIKTSNDSEKNAAWYEFGSADIRPGFPGTIVKLDHVYWWIESSEEVIP